MKRTFCLGRKEYNSFESAYILGRFRSDLMLNDKNIKSFTNSKKESLFVWNDTCHLYTVKGIKSKTKREVIVEELNLFDCYKDIVKNAKSYFTMYQKLTICKMGDSNPILVVDVNYLEVLINVIKVLDKNNAKYSLDEITDDYLNPNIDDILESRKKLLANEKVEKEAKLKEKEINSQTVKFVKPKEIIPTPKIIPNKKHMALSNDDIYNITKLETPKFEDRKIINKDYWVEIRLQTSTIVDKTERGDWKSTIELYNNLRNEFPNKEIALVKNDNGMLVDCFKSSKIPGDISLEIVLNEYRKILTSLSKIRNIKKYAKEEASISNLQGIVANHILENSSFFYEEDFIKNVIKEKCRLDDRREIKTLVEVSELLPDENSIEELISESLMDTQKRLNSYFKYGEKYLKEENVNDIFSFNNEKEYEDLYSSKKNKYKVIKKSNFNKRMYCFSGNKKLSRKEG